MCPYRSSLVYEGPYAALCVLMGFSRFLHVSIGPYTSLFVLMDSNWLLWVLIDSNRSS